MKICGQCWLQMSISSVATCIIYILLLLWAFDFEDQQQNQLKLVKNINETYRGLCMLEHTQWSAPGPDIWVRWSTAQPSPAAAPGVSPLGDSLSLSGPQSGPEHLFAANVHIKHQHKTL